MCVCVSVRVCVKTSELRGNVVGAISSFIYGKCEDVEAYRSKVKSAVQNADH